MFQNIDYEKIENRIVQGFSAGLGTFAMVSVAAFRISQERGFIAQPGSVFTFAGYVSLAAGLVWSLMPAAEEKPSDTLNKAKEQIYPAFKVGLQRILDSENAMREDIREVSKHHSSYSSYRYDHDRKSPLTPGPSSYSRTPSTTSLERVRRRYDLGKDFDDGFEGTDLEEERFRERDGIVFDEDILSDEEIEDILRQDAMEDPFYEGPTSPFDRL